MEESFIGIAKEVFDAFLESETKSEFNKKLKELSLKYHKTSSFLRQIKDDYYFDVASIEEKDLYLDSKLRMSEGGSKYKTVIDNLLSMTDEERVKYIQDEKLYRKNLSVHFNNYFKKYNNEEVYKLKEWVDNYFNNKEKAQYDDLNSLAYTCLEELVGNGYYYVGDYVNDFYMNHDSDKVTFKETMKYIMDYVKYNHPDKYEYYINKMEINRKIRFSTLKYKIDDLLSNIDNYDIIDYYVMFNIPVKNFYRLCKGLISSGDIPKFNKFFNKYLELEKSVVSDEQVLSSNFSFNGVVPTLSDKENTLEFMKENNIPNVYFSLALRKYLNGNLDIVSKTY